MNSKSSSRLEDKARERGTRLVERLNRQLAFGGVVDEYLADQIVIFMALATSGLSAGNVVERSTENVAEEARCELLIGEVSLHTETAMRIAEMALENIVFSTEKVEGGGILMVCERKVN